MSLEGTDFEGGNGRHPCNIGLKKPFQESWGKPRKQTRRYRKKWRPEISNNSWFSPGCLGGSRLRNCIVAKFLTTFRTKATVKSDHL